MRLPGVQNDLLFEALFKFSDRFRTVHTRHEQGAAYMALGAALATGKPQAYAVVPGPGLLNSAAALLTAYSMNAPVLALVGQIPDADIGRGSAICTKSATRPASSSGWSEHSALIRKPERRRARPRWRSARCASGRPGPAALECAMDVWGHRRRAPCRRRLPVPGSRSIDGDAIRRPPNGSARPKRPLIVCGGGAQDAAAEVTALVRDCCRRRCSAIAAAAACSTAAIR